MIVAGTGLVVAECVSLGGTSRRVGVFAGGGILILGLGVFLLLNAVGLIMIRMNRRE